MRLIGEKEKRMQTAKKKAFPPLTEAEARIAELQMEIDRLKNDLFCAQRAHESLQEIHFEQAERMSRELNQARSALEAVVQHCLAPTTPLSYVAQLPGAAPAWKQVAVVLYGGEYAIPE
jgi:hypothetical protein